ncbi:MAG: hypothetical protein KBB95_24575 [Deltaproteobacteria bacterium]|nr:hypothetical protein [Deltaproteobacteria bacterium]
MADPASPSSTTDGTYTLHEWGFIAAGDDGSVRAVSGPHGLSSSSPSSLGMGPLHGVGAGGKPVLYFHLDEGVAELALSVGVRPAGDGRLLEHFPPGELSDDHRALRWPSVRITRGGCRGTYPGLTDARCQTSDGLCELAELSGYESTGADCVNVGEQRTGVLFYRSGPAQAALPLAVTRDAEDVAHVAHAGAADATRVTGWVMRIARGADRTQTRVRVVQLTGREPVQVGPARGDGSVGAEEGIAQLRAAVLAGGLDEPEANAFMTAWTDALFGAEPPPPPPPQPPGTIGMGTLGGRRHPIGSVADAVVYLLPQPSVDALLPLELSPAPRSVQRVFLARVSLSIDGLRVRLEPQRVQGSLSAEVTRRILQRHANALRHCLAADVAPGQVTLHLRVLPAGTVERVSFEGLDIGDETRACLMVAGQRITFPTADAVTSIAQPLTISR